MTYPRDPAATRVQFPERKPPSHILTISVPLNLSANPAAETWDIQGAMSEALRVVMPIIRLGTLGLLCDNPDVTMEEVSGEHKSN